MIVLSLDELHSSQTTCLRASVVWKVQALKEWALASAESKRLALERVTILEVSLSC